MNQAVPEFATVIDPAEGTVASLKEFNIVFKEVDSVQRNDYSTTTKYYIEDKEGNKVATSYESYINEDADGAPLYIAFSDEITAAGTYTLVIPANSYKVNNILGKELRFTYTIEAADKTAYVIYADGVELKDGDELDGISESIVIEFPNATTVEIDESDWSVYATILANGAYGWDEAYGIEPGYAEGNKIIFERSSYVSALSGGDYEVSVPASIITVDGEQLTEDIVLDFSIKVEVPEFTTTINPAEGAVASLEKFDITFSGIDTIKNNNYTSDTRYYIEDKEGNKVYSTDAYINYDEESGATPLHIEFAKIETEGTYTLVLPKGSYLVNGIEGNELTFSYTVSAQDAVKAIFVDGVESVDVYNLNGVRILKNANAEEIRNLDTNVYIINGQKYLLRK